jgi:hypothetical protein
MIGTDKTVHYISSGEVAPATLATALDKILSSHS